MLEIESVRVGPIVYRVYLVNSDTFSHLGDEEGVDISGETQPDKCALLLNRDHEIQQQRVALFHEFLHIILLQGGREYESSDDGLVCMLAHGILQVLIDNQWLLKEDWLLADNIKEEANQ